LWLVEMSAGERNWREVHREEDNNQLNGISLIGAVAVAAGGSGASSGW
jgi:hypothetical protein